MTAQALRRRAADAVQCAVTLVCLLGAVAMIGWASGLASLADIPWVLAGAFGGSLALALIRGDRRAHRH